MHGRLTLIGGGARSGKSRFAHTLAMERGRQRVYLATAEAGDDEMRARIARHVAERGDELVTVEAPRDVVGALATIDADVVVLDCLTLWLSNLCCAGMAEAAIEDQVARLVVALGDHEREHIVVTNEVGLGIVPEHALARLFRDVAGRAHQQLAARADEVYLGAMGAMIRLKPAPVEAVFG
jgi:adenosylcobinamide kinase/adenosylcobinamide-phosphate guanylyltransferase